MEQEDSNRDPPISLLLLQPTSFCNIDCSYCYLPSRQLKSQMTTDVIEKVFANLVRSRRLGPQLRICWHSGEPMVLPPDFYEEAFQLIADMTFGVTEVMHIFQTNGTLISDRWCDLFLKWNVYIGVSIDGPNFLHDERRVDRLGRGTFDRVMKGIHLLTDRQLRFYAICVLTRQSLNHPDEIFEFFERERISEVCFNVEEIIGTNASTSLTFGGAESAVRSFFVRYYDRLSENGFPHWVREIDRTILSILSSDLSEPRNALTEPFRSVNVAHNGEFSTFCPELLSLSNARYGKFTLGNLCEESIDDVVSTSRFQEIAYDIGRGVEACRKECGYFSLCGGGAPSNKLAENGTFASSETLHCRLIVKAVADAMLDVVERGLSLSPAVKTHLLQA